MAERTGFDDVIRDLEDSLFGLDEGGPEEPPKEAIDTEAPEPKGLERKRTLPTLVDQETADKILRDYMVKERNQRKYDLMGNELLFQPYWFFSYTAELVMKDENDNVVDAEEIGGRIAIDAVTGQLADYLQDLLSHEPIEMVDLADELAEVGGEHKIVEPRITEKRLEHFVKQKISGALHVDKDNVSVAGFEMVWSPVYRYWMRIKKRTHRVDIDGCGGYPVNYDDIPLKPKTWFDILRDDIELLSHPKKWREFLGKKSEALHKRVDKEMSGKPKKPRFGLVEAVIAGVIFFLFMYGLANRDLLLMFAGIVAATLLFWYMNARRKKPLVPLPPPPGYGQPQGYAPPPRQ